MEISSIIAEVITPTRIRIMRMLRDSAHPESIAAELGISRQGVDKHLAILHRYGMVDKEVRIERRPMVFYRITPEGEELLRNFEDIAQNHLLAIKSRYRDSLLTLDRMLVDGEISEREYWKRRREMEKRFSWVKKDDNTKG